MDELTARAGGVCELCGSNEGLAVYEIPPDSDGSANKAVLACQTCRSQIDGSEAIASDHWRCLNDSMWSEHLPVQIVAWRMLDKLAADESWAQDARDMMYLDDDALIWARAAGSKADSSIIHKDANGAVLAAGDTVTLIKDLKVKGAGFTAKRGTAVRGISLVADNAGQIEGRVSGQQIVILTEFVKKSG